ncbi:LPXTG cell wall anchor domain-containing protein [Muricoprocola aceti]|uniref:LPXTG cell wall anchor domain-containing protein n=1 Tax=Muricoprocola aceti TaxID=2981772 RepID=A0ABT2SIB6_9FIRM|nr:LPXTG cell wall anchor domain-containing protein [Muricoprocola aceti]MCU6724243.1 LPXTG cell wall anchor domain-containing protein [Muricoprocola aceti]RGD65526.1 LPXTG cell wall anchor domain-containing protein [Lachnospiraceae bacterium OF09-6]
MWIRQKISIKTGDNTPIGMFAGMLAASMTVICVYLKRRRKNQK